MPDRAILTIKVYEDIREGDPPKAIHELIVPIMEEGALRNVVREQLMSHGYHDGYSLEYYQGSLEWGASTSWEEVVLLLSTAIATGAVEAIVASLIEWGLRDWKGEKRTMPDTRSRLDFDARVQSLKWSVSKQYVVPQRLLKLVSSQARGPYITATFEDDLDNHYIAEEAGPDYSKLSRLEKKDRWD